MTTRKITIEELRHRLSTEDFVACIHMKTGNMYPIDGIVINCTNAQADQVMVEYNNGPLSFVREINEFCEKFEFPITEDES